MSDIQASILIVDDNVGMDKTLSFILRRKGYAVTFAENGVEAIEKVKATPFDLIFMDIQMPLMNGTETYKKIREIRPDAAVVMMTAYAVEDLVKEALSAGARGVLYKPVEVGRVLAMIEEARREQSGGLILIVDDDDATCVTLKNILVAKHFSVGVARNGEEALAQSRGRCFDVVLIDMKLPTINGLQTYLELHRMCPSTVAVMMTAYPEEMDALMKDAMKHDAYACIYKPLDVGRLLQLIEEIQACRRSSPGKTAG